MEADWSVQVGADLPAIVVPWEGFVDLRPNPLLAHDLTETAGTPMLTQSLIRLNQESSRVFTSKCDFWALSPDDIDPLEFGALLKDAKEGIACYVDVIARNRTTFASFEAHEAWVQIATNEMRKVRMPQCRTEFVVRPSTVDEREGYALTLYVMSCGATQEAASSVFDDALVAAVTITMEKAAITGE